MIFSGSEIKVDDKVFDVALGHGIVTDVRNGYFSVRFGNRYMRYDQNGRCQTFVNRTLYWRDPFYYVEPPKDDALWGTFINIIGAVSKELLKLR